VDPELPDGEVVGTGSIGPVVSDISELAPEVEAPSVALLAAGSWQATRPTVTRDTRLDLRTIDRVPERGLDRQHLLAGRRAYEPASGRDHTRTIRSSGVR
jgi:hypothetical protein